MKSVLRKATISEKSFALQERGKYVFNVVPEANKSLVKNEVEKLFKVKVKSVNIVSIPGKIKRVGKIYGKRNDIKKAIVTLEKDQKIEEFKI